MENNRLKEEIKSCLKEMIANQELDLEVCSCPGPKNCNTLYVILKIDGDI